MPPVDMMIRQYQRELSQIVASPAFKQLVTLLIIGASIIWLIDRWNRVRRPTINQSNQPINQPINRTVNRPNQSTTVGRLFSSITQTNQPTHLTPAQKYFINQSTSRRCVVIFSDCLLFDDHQILNQSIKQSIQSLAAACRVVIVHQCIDDDDQSEIDLLTNLSINQLIGSEIDGLIPSHRVVSCSTEKGAIAIIRQLEPALLIATSTSVVNAVKPFIVDCVLIDHNTKIKLFNPQHLLPINTINGLSHYSVTSAQHANRAIMTLASLDQWFNGVKLVEEQPTKPSINQSTDKPVVTQQKESALPSSSSSISEITAQ